MYQMGRAVKEGRVKGQRRGHCLGMNYLRSTLHINYSMTWVMKMIGTIHKLEIYELVSVYVSIMTHWGRLNILNRGVLIEIT